MDNGELRRSGEVTNKNYQLRILVFRGCRYSHFSGNGSAFQAEGGAVSLSAGRRPTVMKVIAFQAGIQYANVPMNSM